MRLRTLAKAKYSCWLTVIGLTENGLGICAVRVCLSIDKLVLFELAECFLPEETGLKFIFATLEPQHHPLHLVAIYYTVLVRLMLIASFSVRT